MSVAHLPVPTAALTNPSEDIRTPIPSAADLVQGLSGYASPSHLLMKAIDHIPGLCNPLEWILSWAAGDWPSLARHEHALRRLGQFHDILAADVDAVRAELAAAWTGAAADRADAVLERLARTARMQADTYRSLADAFARLAQGVYEVMAAVVAAAEELLDKLLDIGADLVITAAASETGVGLLVGGAVLVKKVISAERLWRHMVDLYGHATTVASLISGVVLQEGAALQRLRAGSPAAHSPA